MRRHAFLAAGHQMDCEQPLVERDMRPLHNGPGAARELVAAIVALEHPGLRLACHPMNRKRAAMRTNNVAIRPSRTLDMSDCGVLAMEMLGGKVGHGNLQRPEYVTTYVLSQVHNRSALRR
jgi:hypothetical protein